MKPETDNPYRVGTRIIVVKAERKPQCLGATGEIVGPYGFRPTDPAGGTWYWCYEVQLDHIPPPKWSRVWYGKHDSLRPLCPPDPIADDVPAQKEAVA